MVTINSLLEDLNREVAVGGGWLLQEGAPARYRAADYQYAVLLFDHQGEGRNLMHLAVVNLMGECMAERRVFRLKILVESFEAVLDDVSQPISETGLAGGRSWMMVTIRSAGARQAGIYGPL